MKREHDDRSREVVRRLSVALALQRGLPEEDVQSVHVLIDAGEFVIALETLCTQLFEYDVEVDSTLRHELAQLGSELNVDVARALGEPWAEMSWERAPDPVSGLTDRDVAGGDPRAGVRKAAQQADPHDER